MSSSTNSTVLGYAQATRLLGDASFYSTMPEFAPLRATFDAMKKTASAPGKGCGGCRQKRVAGNLMGQFTNIMHSLGPDRRQAMKAAIGAPRVLYYGFNPGRGTFEIREL
jgi:hypothetical protein